MVAGTSIGAFVGGLYCEERDFEKVEKRTREFAKGMARYMDKIFDLTYPTSSMFSGEMVASYLLILSHCTHMFCVELMIV